MLQDLCLYQNQTQYVQVISLKRQLEVSNFDSVPCPIKHCVPLSFVRPVGTVGASSCSGFQWVEKTPITAMVTRFLWGGYLGDMSDNRTYSTATRIRQ